jgi:hypothetical protein
MSDRLHQEGTLKPAEMKANTRYVDGRLDQVTRNRRNMFSDLGKPIPDTTRVVAPPFERPTKHGRTPYTYDTAWITHPDSDSLLAAPPDAMMPVSQADWTSQMVSKGHKERSRHVDSVCNALRYNDGKFHERVEQIDLEIQTSRELNWKDIRAQRAAHSKALDVRRRIEKVEF